MNRSIPIPKPYLSEETVTISSGSKLLMLPSVEILTFPRNPPCISIFQGGFPLWIIIVVLLLIVGLVFVSAYGVYNAILPRIEKKK